MEITEKEFAVIREISNNHLPDQRMIASRTGISLGLTNLIIKRLIGKGYIKARQLNQNKIQYLLTPRGFTEKANKSYKYTLKTIDLLRSVKEIIHTLIIDSSNTGYVEFIITGNSDLSDITELVCNNLGNGKIKFSRQRHPNLKDKSSILIVRSLDGKDSIAIDLISFISEKGLNFWW